MTPDQELMVIFGALHVVALALGAVLVTMFVRSETAEPWQPPEDEDGPGGGGNDRAPATPRSPTSPGGVPLPDAQPARVRFRDHGRLADAYRERHRRPDHAPVTRPRRVPSAH